MPLTAVIFWLTYVGGLCGAVVNPALGAALYVFVYHVNPESQWWGESFAQSGIRPSLTVAAATAIGILVRRPRMEHGARQFPSLILLLMALVGYALLTLTWTNLEWAPTLSMAEKIVKLVIFVLMLVRCVRTPAQYQLVFLSWILGVAYLGYEACGHAGVSVEGRLTAGIGGPDFAESSDLAAHLVASLPLLGALFFMARSWLMRGFVLLVGALAVNTIVMTRTRNALAGLGAMSLLAVFWLPRNYRLKGLAAILVGGLLAAQLADPGWWRRMRSIEQLEQDPSIANRFVFWRAALDMANHEPWGVGLGQFRLRVQDYTPDAPFEHSAHSTYLSCLAELGGPGLLILAAAILAAARQLWRIRRDAPALPPAVPIRLGVFRARFHLGWHTMAIQSALVSFLACAIFCTRLFAEDLWILFGLIACLGNVHAHLRGTYPATQPTGQPESTATGNARWPAPAAGTWMTRADSNSGAATPSATPRLGHEGGA